ncbi:MAG: ATP-binding cassette domain-containing protein [bacterium]
MKGCGHRSRTGRALRQSELDATHLRAVTAARASRPAPGVLGIIAFVVPLIMVRGDAAAPGLLAVALLSLRYVQLLIRGANAALAAVPNHARLQRLLDRLPEPAGEVPDPTLALHDTLALRDVRFTYPARADGTAFHLGPVDLDLSRGRVRFVVGHNGSGKSTLLKGLCGLYPLTEGRVVVDGAPVQTTAAAYRALFAVAFAEPIVHRRLYGLDPDPARVTRLLDEVGLGDKVRYAEGAFDTVELSTGQRKRLSLVLCLLQDRPVVVFDEWAADQDPAFRAHFYRTLVPRLRAEGKALVVISHDDQFFDAADDTLTLADGRMVGR